MEFKALQRKIDREVIHVAYNLVEDNLKPEVVRFKQLVRNQYPRDVELKELIDFITVQEEKPKYRLKSQKHFQGSVATSVFFVEAIEFSKNSVSVPVHLAKTSTGQYDYQNLVNCHKQEATKHVYRKRPKRGKNVPVHNSQSENPQVVVPTQPSSSRTTSQEVKKQNCYMCFGHGHSSPIEKTLPKNEQEICPYRYYPKASSICEHCEQGFHPSNACVTLYHTAESESEAEKDDHG